MIDLATLGTAGAALLGGAAAWHGSKRGSFATITDRLDKELKEERAQRKLLTHYVVALTHWARTVDPGGPAGAPPTPPDELDLTPWTS